MPRIALNGKIVIIVDLPEMVFMAEKVNDKKSDIHNHSRDIAKCL